MHNFRKDFGKNSPYERRPAMDGFIRPASGGARPGHPQHRQHGHMDSPKLGSQQRSSDVFRRPDGFYSSQQPTIKPVAATSKHEPASRKSPAKSQGSILHMTLPGGEISSGRKTKHKRGGKWRKFKTWGLRTALVFGALVLVVGGFLGIKAFSKVNKVFKGGGTAAALQGDVKPELLKGEGDGRINILLLGKGGGNHSGPDLTDTILVASVDPVNKSADLVSLPRDLWVTVSGGGSSKINAVYANAKYRSQYTDPKNKNKAEAQGIKAIEDVVTDVLGIPIHYYTMVDFQAFRQAVDSVGGVDINVPADLAVSEHLWDEATRKNYYLNVPSGMQHFDGTRALFFSRSRHTSVRGDFDRAERQRLMIQALSEKVLSAGTYTNPVKLSQLMSAFGDHVTTDFTPNNAVRLAQIGKGITGNKFKSIGLADPPNNYVRTDNVRGASVVRPTAGFDDYSQIHNFIRNTLRDPYIAKENAAITLLNGTTMPGLATTKSTELKSFGYNVTKIGDAPTQAYANTTIVDMTKGKKPYTRNYLEKRFGAKSVTKLPDSAIQATGADFVIILGQDQN